MWKSLMMKKINKMSYRELMEVMETARRRWSKLYPDWDIVVLTAPKNNPEERKSVFEKAFQAGQ